MGNKGKKKKSSSQSLVLVTILVLVLGFGVYSIISPFFEPEKTLAEAVYEGQPSIGNANAPVKIVEFGDYQCPACKDFHDNVYPNLKKDYIDTGKVQFFFADFQFLGGDEGDSVTAALIGQSIYRQNADAFWKYYDVVYTNQGEENRDPNKEGWASKENLLKLVKDNIKEIDINKVEQDLDNKTYQADLDKDYKILSDFGVSSTPSIFINEKHVPEYSTVSDYSKLKKEIEDALK